MMRPSLNDLTAFMAVASHRSFRRAADELGTAPSTLSNAMRALEERMGVRPLNRITRSVSPTKRGQHLLARLQTGSRFTGRCTGQATPFRGKVAGHVRINAPRLAATILVRDILPPMAERFPDVTVDLVAQGQLIDIVAGIRRGRAPHGIHPEGHDRGAGRSADPICLCWPRPLISPGSGRRRRRRI